MYKQNASRDKSSRDTGVISLVFSFRWGNYVDEEYINHILPSKEVYARLKADVRSKWLYRAE